MKYVKYTRAVPGWSTDELYKTCFESITITAHEAILTQRYRLLNRDYLKDLSDDELLSTFIALNGGVVVEKD